VEDLLDRQLERHEVDAGGAHLARDHVAHVIVGVEREGEWEIHHASIQSSRAMPNIRLPDGSSKSFPGPLTVAEIALAIGPGLARAALAGKVNGKLVDTGDRVDRDADVSIITDKDPEDNDLLRHSTAHLLAHAVKELFPDAQVTIGPVIEN